MNEIPSHGFPDNWQFDEKRHPEYLTILARDIDRKYLSFRYNLPPQFASPRDRKWGEYFFDSSGELADYITETASLAEIGIHEPKKDATRYDLLYNWKTPIGTMNQLNADFFTWLDDEIPDRGEWMKFGTVSYWGDTLGSIDLSTCFSVDGKTFIESPRDIRLERVDDGQTENKKFELLFPFSIHTPSYILYKYDHGYDSPERDVILSYEVVNKQRGRRLFKTNFRVENGIVILEQEHLVSGQTKVVTTPVGLDVHEVYAAFHPELPSGTVNNQGEIEVPWRSITRVVGVDVKVLPKSA